MAGRTRHRLGRRPHLRSRKRHSENRSGGATMIRVQRHLSLRSVLLAAVTVTTSVAALPAVVTPASAQTIVYDPNNYAQNLLTAARSLQQINNQITSLQNQAQMLINQARNLVNLPFSSLLQLEQSILRTQT